MVATSGLIPMLFALTGVMVTLRYLKGVSDSVAAIRYLFFGILFVFLSKLLMFGVGFLGETYYYFAALSCRLTAAVLIAAAACGIKGMKLNFTAVALISLLAVGWSWYVVVLTGDGSAMQLSLAASTLGYAALAAALFPKEAEQ